MLLIDTHAHIYLPDFETERDAIVARAKEQGVGAVLMPAIDLTTHKAMLQFEQDHDFCKSMMGLHPCSVNETFQSELKAVGDYLDGELSFVAVGEIGLDFYWDKTFTAQQYEAFHTQIGFALQKQLPIVIHSRNATDECIEVVEQYPGLRGVFHCFSGTLEQARKVMDLGFYLGIGGVVTFKNAGLDKVVQETGLDKVVLETDAPYLAPVPFRGKRNEPSYTRIVAEKVAEITGRSMEEVAEITSQNAKNLFNL
jgi:TatD DNase family protein